MLFKALVNAKILKDIISVAQTLIDEATFQISQDGIKLRAMDHSRVAMIDLALPKNAFEEYSADEGNVKMCLNIAELLKLLRRTSKDEKVELNLEKETNRLNLKIAGKYTRTFNMPTLEASEEETPLPKITFNASAKVTTEGLTQAIEDAVTVSDHVKIEATKETLTLRATGDLMSAVIELKKGSDSLLDLQIKEESKATYSLSYLSEIIKTSAQSSDIATLEFSNDMPIRINFEQPNEVKLQFYLAPRIEAD